MVALKLCIHLCLYKMQYCSLAILFVIFLVSAEDLHPRGCIYIDGICQEDCELGTHAYTTGCGHLTPEPTCAEPHPKPRRGRICDYSACYCDPPTVRDPKTKKCVQLHECNHD
ncbi:PREDICTED: uncharacterized protein LOC106116645 [Papilio xuthus]|uniref:Uncharacterized protein LOC106116645 n=1 Tax=Papilio xuthus TaxID=66420 RepID=A0AAJ6Z659_PAPXU|nr:PREDICTED: uncharacterized protein LOC106116645 [Papilio xuthus]